MRGGTLILLGTFILGTSGYLIKVPTVPSQPRVGPSGWIHLQKLVLPLFENVCEDSIDPVIARLAQEFTVDSASGVYLKPEVIVNFQKYKVNGFLPKGEIFTNYNLEHVNQLNVLYELFFYAKDFDTFYKSAAWARQNVNCGLFVNAIYLAILNRRDTEKLSFPAPYELLPNYFIQKDIILKASSLLSGEKVVISDTVRDEGNSYILDANYTADIFENDWESKLAYFHEDIALNSYYFLQKLERSPWFNTASERHVNYGEYLYHMMKQLDARYNLERYTNNLPEVEDITYSELRVSPYDPALIYSNGKEFGHRLSEMEVADAENIQILQTIEANIPSIVTHMRDAGSNKSDILNHLMGILVTEDRSFENVLRSLFGKDGSYSQPSVLEHYMTSLRDPVFWRLNKKIVNIVEEGLKVLPTYSRNELYFPGIEILNIDVKKMMTNFDYFQFDVTDALKTTTSNAAFQVKIGQSRLNHKPFVVKLNIASLVSQKGFVKIYLGPKVAPGELTLKKNLFMLLDSFEYNFKMGANVVSRSSEEMNISDDFTSFRSLRKNIEDAEFGLDIVPFMDANSLSQFPSRLILPKGTPDGVPLQLFVFVAPFAKSTFRGIFSIPNTEFNSAILSPGYPLDLNIDDFQLINLPNAMVKDVIVTHKGDKVVNYGGAGVTNTWQQSSYNDGVQSDYSVGKKEPYDYSSKKGQYGKKTDYSGKTKEPFDYNAKKNQYGKKENMKENIEDKQDINDMKNEYDSERDDTGTTKDVLVKRIDLEKDKYYVEDFNDPTLVKETEKHGIPEISNSLQSLQESYTSTKTPSVYDYIRHDDNYDYADTRVYE